ncbi:MAG: thioredoxin family protein [Gammaproteobacteria bacterium]|nr:thioredoxin family protein [Gammaproteobacteria bacterium]
MKHALLTSITFVAALSVSAVASATASVGQAAPDFSVADSGGKQVTLSSFKGKYVVLEWMNPDCPFTQKHYKGGNMQSLQKTYGNNNVVWLTVSTGSHDSPKALDGWLKEKKAAPKALLIDDGAKVASLYGAKTTPHMFVISPEGKLIYAGAIDDNSSANVEDIKVAKNYVRAALDESLAGKAVTTSATQPYGCTVEYN